MDRIDAIEAAEAGQTQQLEHLLEEKQQALKQLSALKQAQDTLAVTTEAPYFTAETLAMNYWELKRLLYSMMLFLADTQKKSWFADINLNDIARFPAYHQLDSKQKQVLLYLIRHPEQVRGLFENMLDVRQMGSPYELARFYLTNDESLQLANDVEALDRMVAENRSPISGVSQRKPTETSTGSARAEQAIYPGQDLLVAPPQNFKESGFRVSAMQQDTSLSTPPSTPPATRQQNVKNPVDGVNPFQSSRQRPEAVAEGEELRASSSVINTEASRHLQNLDLIQRVPHRDLQLELYLLYLAVIQAPGAIPPPPLALDTMWGRFDQRSVEIDEESVEAVKGPSPLELFLPVLFKGKFETQHSRVSMRILKELYTRASFYSIQPVELEAFEQVEAKTPYEQQHLNLITQPDVYHAFSRLDGKDEHLSASDLEIAQSKGKLALKLDNKMLVIHIKP